MQYFSARFMKTYDSIPTDVKPPLGDTKFNYAQAFASDFMLLLRERRSSSLTYMMDAAIEVEVNLLASHKTKQRNETKRVKEETQASTSLSNSNVKFNVMMKAMEKLMNKLSVDDKNHVRHQNDPQIRNPNFRRKQGPHVPQIRQRGQRNPNDQQVRPHFQENLVAKDFVEQPKDHIHHFGNNESKDILKKDEHDRFVSKRKEESNEDVVKWEFDEYQKAYENAMIDFQKKYNLK